LKDLLYGEESFSVHLPDDDLDSIHKAYELVKLDNVSNIKVKEGSLYIMSNTGYEYFSKGKLFSIPFDIDEHLKIVKLS